jgi:predicted O-methyltransferase YrrM
MKLPVIAKSEVSGGRVVPSRIISIRQYMMTGEMEIFNEIVALAKPTVMVEFGVNEGITANEVLLRFIDIERYVGIDVMPEYRADISPQQRPEIPDNPGWLATPDPRFELIVRRHGSLDLTAADLPMCDVAFIDGDHSYKVVVHDSLLAKRIVRQGGVIIWHDADNVATPDVKRALEEFRERGWPIKRVDQTWLAFMEV